MPFAHPLFAHAAVHDVGHFRAPVLPIGITPQGDRKALVPLLGDENVDVTLAGCNELRRWRLPRACIRCLLMPRTDPKGDPGAGRRIEPATHAPKHGRAVRPGCAHQAQESPPIGG